MKKTRVLVVDDKVENIRLVKQILAMERCYLVDEATGGEDALIKLKSKPYDVLMTDWLMPKMNGAELIKRVRSELTSLPYIMMITAIQSSQAKESILEIGADEFVSKPLRMKNFLVTLKEGLARRSQPLPEISKITVSEKNSNPPFMAVVIAASTGGYEALSSLFSNHLSEKAAYFVVQHAPDYSLNNMAVRFKKLTNLNLKLARDGQKIEPGHVYLAPGDKHLCINSKTLSIALNQEPKENYVRPSADPLFRSAAQAFGKYTLGIVLTGLGVDGTQGAAHIKAVGGEILAQDPVSAIAPAMPKSVILSGLTNNIVRLSKINSKIESLVSSLSSELSLSFK
jgi:two-component system, chemotaxis family, protein-glutamate methylesterase/glutaminase